MLEAGDRRVSAYRLQMGVLLIPADGVEEFTDELIDQLLALDPGADVHGSLTSGEFSITVNVDAAETFDAIDRARALVRSAAHAAGASTAGWQREGDVWSWMRPTGPIHADPVGALSAC